MERSGDEISTVTTENPTDQTLTGGLPCFGGPGNSYSLHAIAEMVSEMRYKPVEFVAVGPTGHHEQVLRGGVLNRARRLAVRPRRADQGRVAALPKVPAVRDVHADGAIETYPVRYDWPVRTGIVVGRLDDGARLLATAVDPGLVALSGDHPLGQRISVTTSDGVNRATLARRAPGSAVGRGILAICGRSREGAGADHDAAGAHDIVIFEQLRVASAL